MIIVLNVLYRYFQVRYPNILQFDRVLTIKLGHLPNVTSSAYDYQFDYKIFVDHVLQNVIIWHVRTSELKILTNLQALEVDTFAPTENLVVLANSLSQ